MSKVTIVDNPQITVWCHTDKKIIHHQVHKFLHGQAFRESLMAGAEAMKKYGAKKWLSDDRGSTVLDKADLEWGATVWSPRVIQAGWKYWAIVTPEKVLAKMNMEQLAKEYAAKGVTVKAFSDPEVAMKWLESQ